MAKSIADALTCVEAKALVRTEGDTIAELEAHTDIEKLNEVEAKALVYTQKKNYTFPKVEAKSVADTLTRY